MKWQPADTAPKDRPVLAIINQTMPPVVAIWNGAGEIWSVAVVQADLLDGKWNDTYFETEQVEEIEYWMPIPGRETMKHAMGNEAPKDRFILAVADRTLKPVVAKWDEEQKKWCFANEQSPDTEAEWNEVYFNTDHYEEKVYWFINPEERE